MGSYDRFILSNPKNDNKAEYVALRCSLSKTRGRNIDNGEIEHIRMN